MSIIWDWIHVSMFAAKNALCNIVWNLSETGLMGLVSAPVTQVAQQFLLDLLSRRHLLFKLLTLCCLLFPSCARLCLLAGISAVARAGSHEASRPHSQGSCLQLLESITTPSRRSPARQRHHLHIHSRRPGSLQSLCSQAIHQRPRLHCPDCGDVYWWRRSWLDSDCCQSHVFDGAQLEPGT